MRHIVKQNNFRYKKNSCSPVTMNNTRHTQAPEIPMQSSTGREQRKVTAAAELQEFFYPVHYQVGMALEDALRNGVLTRKQSAILWMIRSAGEHGRRMPRKEIVRLMQSWFEVTNSGLSKAIRGMARPPLNLVQITEDPHSAREKVISLTPEGEQFVEEMAARGEAFLQTIIDHLAAGVAQGGIDFFREWIAAFNRSRTEKDRANR